MENFFIYENEIVDDIGFKLFGAEHLSVLLIIALLIFIFSKYYLKLTKKQKAKFSKICAWLMIIQEIIKDLFVYFKGDLSVGYLPLHLCGIAMFIILYNAYHNDEVSGNIIYCLNMPGALSALLFSNWNQYPIMSYMAFHSFFFHFMIVLYTFMKLASKELVPNVCSLKKVSLYLMIYLFPLYFLNKIWNTNFFFINWPSLGSPLVLFEKWFGNPGYLIPYVLTLLFVWALLYLPFVLKKEKR